MKKAVLSFLCAGALALVGGAAFADPFGGNPGKGQGSGKGPTLLRAGEKKVVAPARVKRVPELDPSTAGAALALLVGGGLVIANRKRLVRAS